MIFSLQLVRFSLFLIHIQCTFRARVFRFLSFKSLVFPSIKLMVVHKYGILLSESKQILSSDCFCDLATIFCSKLLVYGIRHFNNFLCMPLKSSWYNNVQFVWYNKAKQEAHRPIVSIVTVVVLLCDFDFSIDTWIEYSPALVYSVLWAGHAMKQIIFFPFAGENNQWCSSLYLRVLFALYTHKQRRPAGDA